MSHIFQNNRMPGTRKRPLARWNERPASKLFRGTTLLYALIAQAAVVLITVFIVVLSPGDAVDPVLQAAPAIHLPQRQLEHRASLENFQQAASHPRLIERLAVDSLLPDSLPSLPSLPSQEFSPLESLDFLSTDAQAMLGQSDLAGLLQQGASGAVSSFFGIEDTGDRIVLVFNTSASVVRKARNRGVTIEAIQEEATRLIGQLAPGARFGIVQFSQGVRSFTDYLVPATRTNREVAVRWIQGNLRGNPSAPAGQTNLGHEAALAAAFSLQPDVIFLLTDGVLNRREGRPGQYSYPEIPHGQLAALVEKLQRDSPGQVRIHVIGFEMRPSDRQGIEEMVRRYGGFLREI